MLADGSPVGCGAFSPLARQMPRPLRTCEEMRGMKLAVREEIAELERRMDDLHLQTTLRGL